MNDPPRHDIGRIRRQRVQVRPEAFVKESFLDDRPRLPLVLQPTTDGVDVLAWVDHHRAELQDKLDRYGALLLRGFAIESIHGFEQFIRAAAGEAMEYSEKSSPRSRVEGRIYTSTDYPARYPIFLHNENSYAHTWPARLFFYCVTPAASGGETPVADVRRVHGRLDQALLQRFAAAGVLYVRNFSEGLGLPWQSVFGTEDRHAVEAYCRQAGYQWEWLDDGRLRTRRVGPAVVRHPRTGEFSWFNHAAFFHVSTLVPEIREPLLTRYDECDLPHQTYYGDGSSIEPETLDAIREAYRAETNQFPWQPRDILVLDNLLVAHGRAPFAGPRKIAVGMSHPMTAHDLA